MKTCRECQIEFEVTDEDRAFLEKVSPVFAGRKYLISEPTLCYLCRMQRRLAYRSERFLYHRKCDLTGKQIISTYSKEKPFPVYNMDDWWTDVWDPMDYGKDIDFNRPFFEQFMELRNQVPRLALIQQRPMENSDYCNAASLNKNCYLVFSTNRCEDCYYGSWVNKSKDCVDNFNINDCEKCYECVGCRDCYNVKYSIDSSNCQDSDFLRSCSNCRDCFGCTNLVGKQYYIFNKAYSKEEYEQYMSQINLSNHQVVQNMRERWEDLVNDLIVKSFQGINIENSSGNYLRNVKNAHKSFACDNAEDIRYCFCLEGVKDCMDYSYWGVNAELMYEVQASGYDVSRVRFSNLCWSNCSDLLYCDHCHQLSDCFGCVGLKQKKYCILNKQYSKEEYEKLAGKMIEHMKRTGEWGEFFPVSESIYGYNETLAHEQIPLTREEVLSKNWPYQEADTNSQYSGPLYEIPQRIEDVAEDITDRILTCEVSGKPYKIIPQELSFYRANAIPIPRLSPDERHWRRLRMRNPRKLWNRECQKCSSLLETTYSPDRPEKVYCEQCYLAEVY